MESGFHSSSSSSAAIPYWRARSDSKDRIAACEVKQDPCLRLHGPRSLAKNYHSNSCAPAGTAVAGQARLTTTTAACALTSRSSLGVAIANSTSTASQLNVSDLTAAC